MLGTTSLLSPEDERQQSVNDICSCILDNQMAMQPRQPTILELAAGMGQNATNDIAITS